MAQLVLEEVAEGCCCHFDLPQPMCVALKEQFARGGNPQDQRARFSDRFAAALVRAMEAAVDWDLRPPSEAQVAYAMAICRELAVPVPPEALRFRGPMHEYIESNAEAYRTRRRKPNMFE